MGLGIWCELVGKERELVGKECVLVGKECELVGKECELVGCLLLLTTIKRPIRSINLNLRNIHNQGGLII